MAKTKLTEAVVAEKTAQVDDSLDVVIQALKERKAKGGDYNPNDPSMRVAMIGNDRDIWAFRRDEQTQRDVPTLLFKAGWYLSVDEDNLKTELLKVPRNKELCEKIWDEMEKQGVKSRKNPAVLDSVKVMSTTNRKQ